MIEKMEIEHIKDVLLIENSTFSSSWKEKDFLYELKENPYSKYFIIKHNNLIIGYIGLWIIFENSQITNFCIDKKYRNKGFGNQLLKYAINIADKNKCENISLEVRVSNNNAINLYKKNGFIISNIRKSYYSDNNEDAYLMIKPLGGYVNG